jgi:hypothetical protein
LPAVPDEEFAAGLEAHAEIANAVIAKDKTRNKRAGCAIIGDTPNETCVHNTPRELNPV